MIKRICVFCGALENEEHSKICDREEYFEDEVYTEENVYGYVTRARGCSTSISTDFRLTPMRLTEAAALVKYLQENMKGAKQYSFYITAHPTQYDVANYITVAYFNEARKLYYVEDEFCFMDISEHMDAWLRERCYVLEVVAA